MRHGRMPAGAMPVLLAWIGCHRVVQPDAFWLLASDLHPTLTLDDVQELAPGV